jgi:hypothetical protein
MDLNNGIHGERLIQDTTTNPKSMGGLLPSQGGERFGGVGEGGEAARVDSGSGSPSNLLPSVTCSLSASMFSIFAFVCCEIKS